MRTLKQCDNLDDKVLGMLLLFVNFWILLYITPKMKTLVHRAIMEQDMHKPCYYIMILYCYQCEI